MARARARAWPGGHVGGRRRAGSGDQQVCPAGRARPWPGSGARRSRRGANRRGGPGDQDQWIAWSAGDPRASPSLWRGKLNYGIDRMPRSDTRRLPTRRAPLSIVIYFSSSGLTLNGNAWAEFQPGSAINLNESNGSFLSARSQSRGSKASLVYDKLARSPPWSGPGNCSDTSCEPADLDAPSPSR